MTLEQVYAAIGGDYKGVMERLPSADFVRRFALKFLQDDSFPNLKKALVPEPRLRCTVRPVQCSDGSPPRRQP